MTNPEFAVASSYVVWLLRWADKLVRQRDWKNTDLVFQRAVAQDVSPCSCIAYGCALVQQERYREALDQMTTALDIASLTGDPSALAAIFHNFAAVYRELGDYDLARRFQQRAISKSDDCGPEELLGLSNDAWISGRKQLAASLAEAAAGLADSEEDAAACIEAEASLDLIDGLLNEPHTGIRTLLRAYAHHRNVGDLRLMGTDLLNLSVLFGELGRYRGEIAFVRRAIRLFDQAPAPLSAAKARRILVLLERMHSLRTFDPSRN
jgi:tetratricopeptide (TPR) repeat protein